MHFQGHGDLFAPLQFRLRLHALPLAVYGLTYGLLCGLTGVKTTGFPAFPFSARCALYAVPVSFAADVVIVAAWWLFTRLSASRRSTALRR